MKHTYTTLSRTARAGVCGLSLAVALFGSIVSSAVPLSPQDAERFFIDLIEAPSRVPVAFTYRDVEHVGLGGLKVLDRRIDKDGSVRRGRLECLIDATLTVTLETALCVEFGEVEYTMWFRNDGAAPSGTLSGIYAYRGVVPGAAPHLRGIMGDHVNFYAAYDSDLLTTPRVFRSTNGRATHIAFPYFNLVHGDGGTLMALGWAGTWEAGFLGMGDGTHVLAKTCLGTRTVLLPGEKIRTGLVVMLPYLGRNADNASNLWRAWYMKYNLPKANVAGDPIRPFSTVCFAGDTGLPNSDGSISERSTTWKRTLDKLERERILPDFRWFDAGWYCDPSGKTIFSDWWGNIGTWELDHEKWPGMTFRESNEACHALGMKTLVWFEPERVTHVEDLARNFGYKKEWGVVTDRCVTSNIGDDDCLAWTLGRITRMMSENAVDLYREDNNSNPAQAWRTLDERETGRSGLPRFGISENKCIQGHYKLWDCIIDFCAKNGKCTFVDSCAAGGGRNDIESMRRGVPFMRSDFDRATIPMRLSQTWGLCKWLPFHGSSTHEKGHPRDAYAVRASLLPIHNYGGAFSQRKDFDFDTMRRLLAEWKSVRHLLTRDFYTLTPWHGPDFQEGWTSFAYDAPDSGESLILAFRMERADSSEFLARLPFARSDSKYEMTDVDTGKRQMVDGWELRHGAGLKIVRSKKRTSAAIRVKRTASTHPVVVHDMARALFDNLGRVEGLFPDPSGGTWRFLSRREVNSTNGVPLRVVSMNNEWTALKGLVSTENSGFPQLLGNDSDDWHVFPGVAGGRRDRPFKPFEIMAHPAPSNQGDCRIAMCFMPDRTGTYALCADVRALNISSGRVDVSVVLDGCVLWQGEIVREGKTYAEQSTIFLKGIKMRAGQSLELVIGPGCQEASHASDGTGVVLRIVEVGSI